MRRILLTAVCAGLVWGQSPAVRAEPGASAVEVASSDEEAVEQAEMAWSRGDWPAVQALLRPLADDPERLQDERLREKGLCLLADALVNDPDLPEALRAEQAAAYLGQLLDADPDWRLPPAIYSPDLFELFAAVQDRRNQQTSMQCEADRNACEADLAATQADLEDLRQRHAALQQRFADQDVEVRDRVARSRVFAAIPFGVGHFYNGDRILGGVFLGTELALGAAGLTLIVYRVVADGCRREAGFQRGSVVCSSQDLDAILRRRLAEEAVGWVFYGSLVLDVVLAQYRFKPFKTQTVQRVPRRVLDAESGEGGQAPRRRRSKPKPRPQVRPTGSGGRRGVSLGVSVRF